MVRAPLALAPTLAEARRASLLYNLIPVAHTFLDDTETPVSAFLKLRDDSQCFLLESAEQGQIFGRYSFLGLAARESLTLCGDTISIRRGEEVDTLSLAASAGGDPFRFAAEYVARYKSWPAEGLPPFVGGAVGYFGYDLARRVEELPPGPRDDLGLPEMAFLMTGVIVVFDHLTHTISLITHLFLDEEPDVAAAYAAAAAQLAEVKARLHGPLPALPEEGAGKRGRRASGEAAPDVPASTSTFSQERFMAAVEKVKEYILAGDAFQVVLSQRFERPAETSGFSIYRGLRAVNPSPYMYYMSFPDFEVVGSSPEPLVKTAGSWVETRPIAGTRARGRTPEEDAALAQDLLGDEKEKAEHLMLVDLGRNDLGRVCRPGSVHLSEFMAVERYSHVMHLVSAVVGELAEGRTASDALRAAFPAGTVSGAPKVRAMEIIDELEPTRRGPYAGALGYLSYSGELDSCITIRTIIIRGGTAYVQAGAGIVADSDPEHEYEETQNKAEALFRAIEVAVGQEGWA